MIGQAHLAALIAAIVLIGLYAWRDGLGAGRREREVLFLAVAGLAINAAIFGGLSVPVDHYRAGGLDPPGSGGAFLADRRSVRAVRVTDWQPPARLNY